ncbi:MAG: ribose-phosphate pyrophosphokinase [Oscillospiraceae bacterium]|jgi:ribose-phosphate pyrophosphokinase|nr:ribose-phosphate pyrophosphokinase [Oscillospiraceae bacterium]
MKYKFNTLKIFSGNSNKSLAKKIAELLNTSLGKSKVGTFSDGEISLSIDESVRAADCFIIQSTCAPVNDNVMELLIMADALKRASASSVTAVIPYFGYARQDRKTNFRDPITARLIADLITVSGINKVITMDLHSPQIQGFFNIPVDNLLGVSIFASYFKNFLKDISNYVVVAPDLGSISRARNFAAAISCQMAIIDKRREKANISEVVNIIGDVKNKKVILIDDMIDTAGTICNAAEAVVEKGALDVCVCATHAVVSFNAVERINKSLINSLLFLDTIPFEKFKICKKTKIISTDKIFSETIKRIHDRESLANAQSSF